MAFDAYLKIDGIDGESTDSMHRDWSEIIFFGANMSQGVSSTASSAGGATSGRAEFDKFIFTKLLDKASPKLALACAAGTHINTITLAIYRAAGSEKVKFMEYKMTNCIISAITTTGGGEFPHETVEIDFGTIYWSYAVQNRQGGRPAGHIAAGWDRQRNCRL